MTNNQKMTDYDQRIMDLEQELEAEKEQHSNDVEDLKYFYKLLLKDYIAVIINSGQSDDLAYTRKCWEERIKYF